MLNAMEGLMGAHGKYPRASSCLHAGSQLQTES